MNAHLIAKIDDISDQVDIQILEARQNEVVGGIAKAKGLIALAKANPHQAHFVEQLEALKATLLDDLATITAGLRLLRTK